MSEIKAITMGHHYSNTLGLRWPLGELPFDYSESVEAATIIRRFADKTRPLSHAIAGL